MLVEIREGCGISDKDIYIKTAGITFHIILDKSNSDSAMIIFALQSPSLTIMAVSQTY